MDVNVAEALRYLGASGAPEELRRQVAQVGEELSRAVAPRYTYRVFSMEREGEAFVLPQAGITLSGRTARTMLSDCDQTALLCCTLGVGFTALLQAKQARDMAQAVILDACGSALVEGGCDAAQEELARRCPQRYCTDRFSPGYGDLPLDLQRPLCALLDTPRRLGVQVTDSLLLNPGKSVTAIVGLSDRPQAARIRGCAFCTLNQTCPYRKEGTICGA